jgi:hypothetical protein
LCFSGTALHKTKGDPPLKATTQKLLAFNLIIAVGLFMFGCSPSNEPSLSVCRRALENKIKKESEGRIELLSFEKKDGQPREFMGIRMYALDYKATIKFKQDCYWGDFFQGKQWMGQFITLVGTPPKEGTMPLEFQSKLAVKKGQTVPIENGMNLQKTDNGWSLVK